MFRFGPVSSFVPRKTCVGGGPRLFKSDGVVNSQ
jgi:hypothetical protein